MVRTGALRSCTAFRSSCRPNRRPRPGSSMDCSVAALLTRRGAPLDRGGGLRRRTVSSLKSLKSQDFATSHCDPHAHVAWYWRCPRARTEGQPGPEVRYRHVSDLRASRPAGRNAKGCCSRVPYTRNLRVRHIAVGVRSPTAGESAWKGCRGRGVMAID